MRSPSTDQLQGSAKEKAATIFQLLEIHDDPKITQDPGCKTLAGVMFSLVHFQLSYHQMSYFMDEKALIPVTAGQALKEEYQSLTTTGLGETLYAKMSSKGRDIVKAWSAVRHVLGQGLEDLDMLLELREASGELEPMPREAMQDTFSLQELDMHIDNLVYDSNAVVEEAEIFVHNVYRSNRMEGAAQALVEELMRLHKQIDEYRRQLYLLRVEEARLIGEVAGARQELSNVDEARLGEAEMVKYLEDQLAKVNLQLSKATDDEKSYTYNMYNSFISMWENDVKLAKNKVQRYTTDKAVLEKKLEDMKITDRVKSVISEEHVRVQAKLAHKQGNLTVVRGALTAKDSELKELKSKADNHKKRLDEIVADDHKETVHHFFAARQALNNFAVATRHQVDQVDTAQADWKRPFKHVKKLAETLCGAKTLEAQQKSLQLMKKLASRSPILSMIRDSRSNPMLTPEPSEHHVFSNLSNLLADPADSLQDPLLEDAESSALCDV